MTRIVPLILTIAVAVVVLGVCVFQPAEAIGVSPERSTTVWNHDTAVRVWRSSDFARVHEAQGEWMLVAAAYERDGLAVPERRDVAGLKRPDGSSHPLMAVQIQKDRLTVSRLGHPSATRVVATQTSIESLLPEPMLLDARGLRMSCRHLPSELHRPEQLLCRRSDPKGNVNYECFARAGLEHPQACLF